MNIGLDYDDTYTRDPATWDKVLEIFRAAGHKVYVTTWRFDDSVSSPWDGDESAIVLKDLTGKVDGFYFTGRKAKEKFMYSHGIRIDVWFDDNPMAVIKSMEGYEG